MIAMFIQEQKKLLTDVSSYKWYVFYFRQRMQQVDNKYTDEKNIRSVCLSFSVCTHCFFVGSNLVGMTLMSYLFLYV